MKLKNKKLFKIFIIITIAIVLFFYIYLSVISFNKNDIQTKGLVLLSETSDIRSILSKYHLQYGEYPKSNNDIMLNGLYLCNYSFQNNSNNCDKNILLFKQYGNDFVYEKNSSGLDYSIRFTTNYDSAELGCIHTKNENKKGCTFKLSVAGLSVEK